MDKYEQRRKGLLALVKQLGRGGIAQIAAKIDKEANYVSRMLYEPGKAGRKRIGEDTADQLDAAYPEWKQLVAKERATAQVTTLIAREPDRPFMIWPFKDVKPEHWDLLEPQEKKEVENHAAAFVRLHLPHKSQPEKENAAVTA